MREMNVVRHLAPISALAETTLHCRFAHEQVGSPEKAHGKIMGRGG